MISVTCYLHIWLPYATKTKKKGIKSTMKFVFNRQKTLIFSYNSFTPSISIYLCIFIFIKKLQTHWYSLSKFKRSCDVVIILLQGFVILRSCFFLNPLSPSIHIQIPQTDLHTFPLRISWENLIKHQGIFSFVIIFYILTTLSLDNVWTLLGENWCWSLLGLKGLTGNL